MIRVFKNDKGTAAVEFVGLLPILLLVTAAVFQLGLAGWAAIGAGDAATAAARAASLGKDPRAAADGALTSGLTLDSVRGRTTADGHSYTVKVDIPEVFGFDVGTVERTASMPDIR